MIRRAYRVIDYHDQSRSLHPMIPLVPTARLELTRLSPLPPQDSVSTNFTTSALQLQRRAVFRITGIAAPLYYSMQFIRTCYFGISFVFESAGSAGAPSRRGRRCRRWRLGLYRIHDAARRFGLVSWPYRSGSGWSERISPPRRRSCATGNWPNPERRTGCPKHRCRRPRPCLRPCRAESAPDR